MPDKHLSMLQLVSGVMCNTEISKGYRSGNALFDETVLYVSK